MHHILQTKHPSDVSQGQDEAERQDFVYCDRFDVELYSTQHNTT